MLSPADITSAGLCIGCGSCVAGSTGVGMAFDRYGQLKPDGPRAWLSAPSRRFTETCPFSPGSLNEDELARELFAAAPRQHPATGRFEAAYVGYATEMDLRATGSSGGITTWMLTEL